MSEKESAQGLTCPKCGGVVPIPEGQVIVKCPYCDLRSLVRGERGVRRFQVPLKCQRDQAIGALRRFFGSNMAIARGLADQSTLSEAFLVYLPFWTVWARVAAWVFGEKQVGDRDHRRYEAREMRVVQEMTWNGAACDVGEFGVTQAPIFEQDLQPFKPEELHNLGMVFEPVGSTSEARLAAEKQFTDQVNKKAGLDRISQLFVRNLRQRFTLVYHPLWVLRYLYRGRSFQVVVDGYSGSVLYGKAPGNTLYRAAMLVLGMAFGAFVSVDVTVLLLYIIGNSSDSGDAFWLVLLSFLFGLGVMFAAYSSFRFGEQYEYRLAGGKKASQPLDNLSIPLEMVSQIKDIKDIEQWINRLT